MSWNDPEKSHGFEGKVIYLSHQPVLPRSKGRILSADKKVHFGQSDLTGEAGLTAEQQLGGLVV